MNFATLCVSDVMVTWVELQLHTRGIQDSNTAYYTYCCRRLTELPIQACDAIRRVKSELWTDLVRPALTVDISVHCILFYYNEGHQLIFLYFLYISTENRSLINS
jgi:hypothetical protein